MFQQMVSRSHHSRLRFPDGLASQVSALTGGIPEAVLTNRGRGTLCTHTHAPARPHLPLQACEPPCTVRLPQKDAPKGLASGPLITQDVPGAQQTSSKYLCS